MAFRKSSDASVKMFESILPDDPRSERKSMFGCPCGWVNGNLHTGLFEDRINMRLDEKDRAKLLAVPGARQFEPMAGRAMKEFVEVPVAMMSDAKTLRAWMKKSFDYTAAMPPKEKGAKRPGPKAGGMVKTSREVEKTVVAKKAAPKKKS